jgi:hypothetical protein
VTDRLTRKDAKISNYAFMLVLRALWVARVFDNNASAAGIVLDKAMEEWILWLSSRCGFLRGVDVGITLRVTDIALSCII